ncbi:Porin P precursor [Gemmata sp. SH-PL17]|uniref:OprO/OprP family phosphate-selective porin n=1 Tax=Gemmata sp. SH-PL17 TaxID=1630693 RepID=UPI00078E3ACC|nr:porin [Gemmata sp. SH-PL17]AMV25333.1 Porin P precursor [Gemmata sp. SH-PL17]
MPAVVRFVIVTVVTLFVALAPAPALAQPQVPAPGASGVVPDGAPPASPAGAAPVTPTTSSTAPTVTLTPEEIKKLVEQTIAEREEKAKQAEAEKKAESQQKSRKVTGTWNNGLTFETEDKAFRFNVGGVTQFDMGWFNVDKNQKRSIGTLNNLVDPGRTLDDGMDFRRARLRMSGLAWEQLEFFAQYEFANGTDLRQRTLGIPNSAGIANPLTTNTDPAETVGFNEVYIGLTKLPVVGTVRVGRHRESLNFVTATADNNQVWMERGLMFDAFNGNYNFSNGITVSRTFLDDRAYALIGLFEQNSQSNRQFSTVGDGNYVYDARLTCLPVWNESEHRWVHLGVDYSYRNLNQDNVRVRARPDIRIGSGFQVPNLFDTGNIFSRDAQQIANLEFVTALGPWTMAAEGTVSTITNAYLGGLPVGNRLPTGVTSHGTYVATGGYVEVMRFLTPDHRGYVKDRPGYARVTPSRRFVFLEGDGGRWRLDTGAWEVGVRYDYVDLTNSGINGGIGQGVTGAVNWYLTSNARIQFNYSWIHRGFNPADAAGRQNGDLRAFGVRFNCDF